MFSILRKARTLDLIPKIQIELFQKLVLLIVLFGAKIWAYEDFEKIDKFYLRFLRYVLKLNTSTPISMILVKRGNPHLNLRLIQNGRVFI